MKTLWTVALAYLVQTGASAVTIGVIDSGVDYKHKDLSPRMWMNTGEIAGNGKDDDGNGFVDDVYGWNFAEGNADVIDYKHLGTFSEDCYKFFRIQGKTLRGTATAEEIDWMKRKREDQTFLRELMKFGNFVHGSHVGGITSVSRSVERMIAVKIIPTEVPGMGHPAVDAIKEQLEGVEKDSPFEDMLVQFFLGMLVDQQVGTIVKSFEYVVQQKADVVNGSFGVSYASASQSVSALLQMILGREPTEDQVKKHTRYLIDTMNDKLKPAVQNGAATLWVFAAANDGMDNDDVNVAPAGLSTEPNVMSVAATMGIGSLASFSNYGVKAVDIAAPGVAIDSTVPGDRYLEMSGTSMAAPYVAHVAALVKDLNGALKPADIKRLLMGTVDKKPFLASKVVSGGIVNAARAVEAAKLSRTMPLADAIAQAGRTVADTTDTRSFLETADDRDVFVVPLPSIFR